MSLEKIFTQPAISDIKREIIMELMDSSKNLSEKTQIEKPLKWSALKTLQEFIENKKLPKSSTILERFMKQSFRFLISKSRKGREEYIQALHAIGNSLNTEEKDSIKNKLIGSM